MRGEEKMEEKRGAKAMPLKEHLTRPVCAQNTKEVFLRMLKKKKGQR